MESRYELFDHTADAGVRVFAPTLTGLLLPAAHGLYAVIGELVPQAAAQPRRFELAASEPALLLRDWLAELLELVEERREIVTDVQVEEFDRTRLTLVAQLSAVDATRSAYEREAKAVTYHQLGIRPVPGGYEATFIVDI
jgi:SHS2 domain-containing protein